jgi:hypothetical protein
MGSIGEVLIQKGRGRPRVFGPSLWKLALAGGAALIGVNLALGLSLRRADLGFRWPLAWNAWLISLLFAFAVPRLNSHTFARISALCFPMAVVLTEAALFPAWGLRWEWYALGLALITPLYLAAARFASSRLIGSAALDGSKLLIPLAAVWALLDVRAAAWVHLILAGAIALAVRWLDKPRLIFTAGAFLLSGSAAWAAGRGLPLAQISLMWGLISILWIAASLRATRLSGALYSLGWLSAGLAILPALTFFDRGVLVYALGQWAALNAWLALLAHEGKLPGLAAWLKKRPRLTPIPFQWLAAFTAPIWAWQAWLNTPSTWLPLPAGLTLLAWVLLAAGARFGQTAPRYARPWQTAALLTASLASALTVGQPQRWLAAIFLGLAGYFFAAARLQRRSWLLWPAVIFFPLGLANAAHILGMRAEAQPSLLALTTLLYLFGGLALERGRKWPRAFMQPLGQSLTLISPIAFGFSGLFPPLWGALACLLLALAFAVRACIHRSRADSYAAAWLGAIAGGLAASAYSQGTGRSALLAALLTWAYLLAERGLTRASRGRAWLAGFRRLFRAPLISTAWLIAAGTVGLVFIRNVGMLRSRTAQSWGDAALWALTALFALAGWWYFGWHKAGRFTWAAAGFAFPAGLLLLHILWPEADWPGFALGWVILAAAEWGIALGVTAVSGWGRRPRRRRYGQPLEILAHATLPLALVITLNRQPTALWGLGIALLIYLLSTWLDTKGNQPSERFLYPVVVLAPLWAVIWLAYLWPGAQAGYFATLLMAFSLPALGLGRWFALHDRPAFRLPLYLLAYAVLPPAVGLTIFDQPWPLIGVLLFCTVVFGLSTRLFRRPFWMYPAFTTLTLAWGLALDQWRVPVERLGWGLLALAGLYALGAWITRRMAAASWRYAIPWVIASLGVAALSLAFSSLNASGTIVGFAGAAVLCLFYAFWLRLPIFQIPASALAWIAYLTGINQLPVLDFGLALWPGIALSLAAGVGFWYRQKAPEPFAWNTPLQWPMSLGRLVWMSWSFCWLASGFGMAAWSGAISSRPVYGLINWLLAAAAYGLALALFRRRFWLLAGAAALQLAALSAIATLPAENASASGGALLFAPVMGLTLLAALILGRNRTLRGWDAPLFVLLAIDLPLMQMAAFEQNSTAPWVTLCNALAVAALTLRSPRRGWAMLALAGLTLARLQALFEDGGGLFSLCSAAALLGMGFGLAGYSLRWLLKRGAAIKPIWLAWDSPLRGAGWLISVAALGLIVLSGRYIPSLAVRAWLGQPLPDAEVIRHIQIVVNVFAMLGLFFLAAAAVERWRRLAYGAVALLLGAWSLEWLLIWGQREVQGYAIPAGLYLLGMGYLEWTSGRPLEKALGRWIDQSALLLLMGSSFWQSLGDAGGWYALLLGAECLLILWWGSARRLRRFLYAGVAGMVINLFGQLIDPLLSVNRWIVFGAAGGLLVTLAILVERRLERVLKLSAEVRKRLEDWE